MPILQRIIKVGNSRAVVIPSAWLDYHEKVLGKPLDKVGLQVNDVIIISPVNEKKGEPSDDPVN